MKFTFYQVDAFADQLFQGNPAAVFVLEDALPDQIMQALAGEMNLSETAFAVKRSDGDFRLRWFTPKREVKLCGHATLATAHVLYQHYQHPREPICFHTQSGILITTPDDFGICLDFPATVPSPIKVPLDALEAVGGSPRDAYETDDLILVYSDASEVAILEPDFAALTKLPYRGICVTAPGNGNGYDFVSRFFAPSMGIDEDPVTGSAHTKLTPLYALRTGKDSFFARQVSQRGGDLQLHLQGDRVFISGKAITVFEGTMSLPGI